MDHGLGIESPIASIQSVKHLAKQPHFVENGVGNTEANAEVLANKSDKVKAMAQVTDLDIREADLGRTGGPAHTRKSSDSPAVVPIKKRRIQILEAPRSPSPPSSLPQSSSQKLLSSHGEVSSSSLSNPSCSGSSSVSSPKSSVQIPGAPSLSQPCPPHLLDMQSLECETVLPKVIENSAEGLCSKLDPNVPLTKIEERLDDDDEISGRIGFAERQVAQNEVSDVFCCQSITDGQLTRSESGSLSRDDRLHWDLNTDMEAWDDSNEQVTSKISEEKCRVTPCRSSIEESAGINREAGNENSREHLEDNLGTKGEDPGNDTVCIVGGHTEDTSELVGKELCSMEVVAEEQEVKEVRMNDCCIREEAEGSAEIECPMDDDPNIFDQDFSGNSDHRDTDKEETNPPSVHTENAWQLPDDPADYPDAGTPGAELSPDGRYMHDNSETLCCQDDTSERHQQEKQRKTSIDDQEVWDDERELEEHVDYGDSDCKDTDDPGLDADDGTSSIQGGSKWMGDNGLKVLCYEGKSLATSEGLHSSLPDTGQHTDKYLSSGRNRTTGWDQLPEGFDCVEEALRAAKEEAGRGGRGSSWSNRAGRGSWQPNRYELGSVRSHNRDGFSSAREDNFYLERHTNEPVHDRDGFRHTKRYDDNFSVRGRDTSRRTGGFGRGRASRWLDSQSGHMNQWGSGRHRSGSGYSGPSSVITVPPARGDKSGFVASSDGTVTKNGMGPYRRGLRSAVTGGRVGRGGHTRGPPIDMDGGAHYPLRRGAMGDRVGGMGLGSSGSMHDRSGRVIVDVYRGRGLNSRRSLSPRTPHVLDHPNMVGRMTGIRPASRVVRSRTPPSIDCPMGSSDFNIVRNQYSPLSSRLSNKEREPDNYRDQDFKRLISRAKLPPQRTLPHVIHGSALTDECDRQAFARHSPPSHLRKSKDDSLDSRALKRVEEEDGRYVGVYGKDGDYGRGSPMRETGRERQKGTLYRRDRERDDERRRDFRRSSSRDGRFSSVPRHSSIREGDDDVAPRRRRLQ